MARVASVENRRWLLRATNTGLRFRWTLTGHRRATAGRYSRRARRSFTVSYDGTPYARWGDWLRGCARSHARVTVVEARDAFARAHNFGGLSSTDFSLCAFWLFSAPRIVDALRSVAEGKSSAEKQSRTRNRQDTNGHEDLQRRQDELQKRIELVRSYLYVSAAAKYRSLEAKTSHPDSGRTRSKPENSPAAKSREGLSRPSSRRILTTSRRIFISRRKRPTWPAQFATARIDATWPAAARAMSPSWRRSRSFPVRTTAERHHDDQIRRRRHGSKDWARCCCGVSPLGERRDFAPTVLT